MRKTAITLCFLVVILSACVPEPEPPAKLEPRKSAEEIVSEVKQLEEQARQEVREKIEAREAEAAKPEEEPAPEPSVPKPPIQVEESLRKSWRSLGAYPSYFLDGEAFKPNFVTVVGDEAPSSYVVAISNLMAKTPGNKPVGFSMLASEISDLDRHNAIVVGNACNNEVIARLLGNPSPCDKAPLPEGKGLVRLYEATNGNLAIMAAGRTDAQVIAAVGAIGSPKLVKVTGYEVCVQGTSLVAC